MSNKLYLVGLLMVVGVVSLTLSAGNSQLPEMSDGATYISIVSLLSSPEKYDGELVRVEGFLHFRMGDHALYLSEDAATHGMIASALWLKTSPETVVASHRKGTRVLTDLDRRYVSVTGVFDTTVHGHLGAFPEGLRNVELVRELRVTK